MPLTPFEKAELALWLSAARHLDPECCPTDDEDAGKLLNAARGVIHGKAAGAAHAVKSDQHVSSHLLSAANDLTALMPPHAFMDLPQVRAVHHLLIQLAQGVRADSGDGQVVGSERGITCRCGVLDFAEIIENELRVFFKNYCQIEYDLPNIFYRINLTKQMFGPFRLNGEANIRRVPRTVTLAINSEKMGSRDLWHIAYTLFHELVCHAFQGALAVDGPPNAHASCHWTEGWMDALAFDIVNSWLDRGSAPKEWLPLQGQDARGELWTFHNARYTQPVQQGLSPSQMQRRRLAREAYQSLPATLMEFKIADSEEEARQMTCKFTVSANIHPQATCHRLSEIGTNLRICLLNKARPQAAIGAAAACIAFSSDRNFPNLEAALEAAATG